jgi:hypothetical protein
VRQNQNYSAPADYYGEDEYNYNYNYEQEYEYDPNYQHEVYKQHPPAPSD